MLTALNSRLLHRLFDTCINRTDVDEGNVFKTYTEYERAVAEEAAKLVADDDDLHAQDQESDEPVTPALRGSVVSTISISIM